MNKGKELTLDEFMQTSKFSDDVLRSIFIDLATTYKDETPRQHLIRAIVELFIKRYPAEMAAVDKYVQKKRELQKNEFAADKTQDIRLTFSIPQSLLNRLDMFVKDPKFLNQSTTPTKEEKEELEWFLKNFPQFTIAKKQ